MADYSKAIQAQLKTAVEAKQAVKIINANSLTLFSQHNTQGEAINVSSHSGIIHYAPEELVIQVRAGTTIKELQDVLAEKNQQLSFEPPRLSDKTTIGGIIACGLTGSSMPFLGSVKDAILGVRMLNGLAENLIFGGVVIKNVAGFDLTRLQAGAFGQYGILLDIAIKVIPKAPDIQSIVIETDEAQAIKIMNALRQKANPLSAMVYYKNQLTLRLSGYQHSNSAFKQAFDYSYQETDNTLWEQLNQYKHPRFNYNNTQSLYRISTTVDADPIVKNTDNEQLIDWAGGLRWLKTDTTIATEGETSLFNSHGNNQENPTILESYKQKLKRAFDPYNLINAN
jgi:glycolate oxidase FAD binding subunit